MRVVVLFVIVSDPLIKFFVEVGDRIAMFDNDTNVLIKDKILDYFMM